MKKNTLAWQIFIILIITTIAYMIYTYPILPERVASHFGKSGKPNGWSSKNSYILLTSGIIGFISLILVGLSSILPKIPASMINIQNREYWFAPERKTATLSLLSYYLLWMNNATIIFFMAINHLIVRFNLGKSDHLENVFWPIFTLYILSVSILTIRLLFRFRKPV